jgi:hypothetical protein
VRLVSYKVKYMSTGPKSSFVKCLLAWNRPKENMLKVKIVSLYFRVCNVRYYVDVDKIM